MDHDLGIETGGNEFHPAALRLYEPCTEANPRDRVLRQDLTPTGVDNAPTHHPDTQEAVAELHVKPELHQVPARRTIYTSIQDGTGVQSRSTGITCNRSS